LYCFHPSHENARLIFPLSDGKRLALVPADPSHPIPPKPNLLEQVRNTLRGNHYSLRAEEAYLQWIRRFILFHGKRHSADPREITAERELVSILT